MYTHLDILFLRNLLICVIIYFNNLIFVYIYHFKLYKIKMGNNNFDSDNVFILIFSKLVRKYP